MDIETSSKALAGFEVYLKSALNDHAPIPNPQLKEFWNGMNYSLFGGGKRFRPLLSILTAKALKSSEESVYALASAIEMIHTYSLIHDDLPCLDNDDERRGRPTHHKKYGEDMALLAGDGLLTLAFFTLANSYTHHPKLAEVVCEVAKAAGIQGMVSGQVLDMKWQHGPKTAELLKSIHEMKTGALISVSVRMSAVICGANDRSYKSLSEFGDFLGLAFQIADDVQDAREGESEKNFSFLWGEERALKYLTEVSSMALDQLKGFDADADPLRDLVKYNISRI